MEQNSTVWGTIYLSLVKVLMKAYDYSTQLEFLQIWGEVTMPVSVAITAAEKLLVHKE